MAGYTKLFTRILDSTIWREDDETRILWITMLAMADQDGLVLCTIPGLADRARISLAATERALKRFQEPDKYSWSQEHEGRRIRVTDGGWELINHAKFRSLMSAEENKEKTRIRVAKWRERKKLRHKSVTVTKSNASNDIAEAEAEAEAEVQNYKIYTPSSSSASRVTQTSSDDDDGEKILKIYKSNSKTTGRINDRDKTTALELLKNYSLEQIEDGILLASARRNGDGKINSLAYFVDAIAEAAADPNMTPTYRDYLRKTLQKAGRA